MKKNYIKPSIIFESFSISTNIAAGCEGIVGNPTEGVCGIKLGPDTIFICGAEGSMCDMPSIEEGTHNTFCYHAPTEDHNLFNS